MRPIESRFSSFIDKIPKNIHNNTSSFIGKNIAVFSPQEFVIEKSMILEDYHFVIFYTTPPSANIDEEEFQFKKGNLICMSPGAEITPHSLKNISPVNYIAINVNKGFFEKISLEILGKTKVEFKRMDNFYSHQLISFVEFFIDEIINYGNGCSLMLESLEKEIVIQILRDTCSELLIHKPNNTSDNDYIDQAIKYMESYYSSNITIAEICRVIHVSPSHFQRIFKSNIGQTPYFYLVQLRLNKSKEMLKNTDASIEEISRLCGFVNTGHFSTNFKRIEGVSPSQYRKLNT